MCCLGNDRLVDSSEARIGTDWRDRDVGARFRLVLGGVFAVIAVALLAAGLFSVMGETFPSHVGVIKGVSGAPTIQIVLCPGEKVNAVEVDWGDGRRWRASSSGSTVDHWTVGQPLPAGFRLDESASEQDMTVGTITVSIQTNRARWGDVFDLDEITAHAILFDYEQVTPSDFPDVALNRYPCDDPDGRKAAWRLSILLIGLALVAGLVGLMLSLPFRSRTAHGQHDV